MKSKVQTQKWEGNWHNFTVKSEYLASYNKVQGLPQDKLYLLF